MNPSRNHLLGGLALSVGLLATSPARAASLTKVNSWGASGVPATASMYIYVPDKPATKPPIVVLVHYCGGTAANVFGQASGIKSAADQYGFIMVVPQTTNNCWDIGSTKSLTHDGGGETQAIAQMVKYAVTTYSANAERVYITGDSSGAMMTEGMLAVYPEVFKGGAEFAGVPAGCWAVGDPDGSWSSQCAGGQVTHTEKEWGDLVRAMYPGYAGHRPRVQLFHGDADSTINFKNHTEAIKEWVNVLGLSTEPTTTETVTLGSHQATRQQWKNACGYVVLDAFQSKGGDHGPSDALFNTGFVVPFLALSNTDATDPEIAMCGAGGTGGTGGMGGTSGMGNSGGASAGGAASGGAATMGGATGNGGTAGSGSGTAGAVGVGGMTSMGGNTAMGGAPGSGGTVTAGGAPGAGGTPSTGGSVVTGGNAGAVSSNGGRGASSTSGTGGTVPATGGATMSSGGMSGAGHAASVGGSGGETDSPTSPTDPGGCGCRVSGSETSPVRGLATGLLGVLALGRRRFRARRRHV